MTLRAIVRYAHRLEVCSYRHQEAGLPQCASNLARAADYYYNVAWHMRAGYSYHLATVLCKTYLGGV